MHNLLLDAFPGTMGVQVNIVSSVGIFLSADGRRSLSAATCSGRYTAPNISVDKEIRNLSFATRGGSEEPVPTPGFATFPPPECNDGGCLPKLGSGGSMVPDACKPVYSATSGWTKPDACTEAEVVGPLCHPDRFGGYCYFEIDEEITTCEKDPVNPMERYPIEFDFDSRRYGCPRIEPCTPTTACATAGNVSMEGYVNYYEPFSLEKAIYEEGDDYAGRPYTKVRSTVPVCKVGHLYLPNGTCFAPRCSQCNPKTHFRLDGLCQPCPEVPWLIPLIILGCMVAGIGTVALSRVWGQLCNFEHRSRLCKCVVAVCWARVPWPGIMLDIFINLRLFSIDIDLTAPECFIRGASCNI